MKPLTIDGKLDHLFIDDRGEPSGRSVKRAPRYASNNLHKPKRALTDKEASVLNSVGLPKRKR